MSPLIPFEIERMIFETAAFLRPKQVPTLMLVAWRVHQWVEPLLYRTLCISMDSLPPPMSAIPSITFARLPYLIALKDPAFLAKAVRNVLISPNVGQKALETICSAFPNIENLFSQCTLRHPELPQLRRLHCFPSVVALDLRPNFAARFPALTHLRVLYIPGLWSGATDLSIWRKLPECPSLTHLAFNGSHSADLCTFLLSVCKRLRVLLLVQDTIDIAHTDEFPPALTWDPRFLIMRVDEDYAGASHWKRGALHGFSHDTWARADAFGEERKNGAVPRDNFILPPIRNFSYRDVCGAH
ncbi:hypothetical protein C8F01DRAFT_1369214 [Mycena amicta]|nr:hypothetical protein C8F01DRAFT_1369214 [Mycena amicta]